MYEWPTTGRPHIHITGGLEDDPVPLAHHIMRDHGEPGRSHDANRAFHLAAHPRPFNARAARIEELDRRNDLVTKLQSTVDPLD